MPSWSPLGLLSFVLLWKVLDMPMSEISNRCHRLNCIPKIHMLES